MKKTFTFKPTLLAATLAILSPSLYASGFQIFEQSASGLGRAFSGQGVTKDNAAVGNQNPASMTLFSRPELSVGLTFVDPDINLNGTSFLGNSLKSDDTAPSEYIPNAHYIHPINQNLVLGAFLTSNYGLSTKFDEQYAAGMMAGKTKLLTGNLNFSAATRLTSNWSLGLGLSAIYAKAKLTRHFGELADIRNSLGLPSARDTEMANLSGDRWGFGWNAGAMYEANENHRFGLSYRSSTKLKFKGDYSNQIGSGFDPMFSVLGISGLAGSTISGRLDIELPSMWEFSAYHKVAPQWAIHYGFSFTNWHVFEQLLGADSDGKPLFQKSEEFKNSMRLSFGTTYTMSPDLSFRAGIAFDDSATSKEQTISIPDQDRVWLTVGMTYNFTPAASIDAGFAYIHGLKTSFTESVMPGVEYSFDASGKALIYALNFNYRF